LLKSNEKGRSIRRAANCSYPQLQKITGRQHYRVQRAISSLAKNAALDRIFDTDLPELREAMD
jgi:hypothetical protein